MVQSILLVISVIIITMSFVYDKSVKELIENPPPAVMELFQDGTEAATEGAAIIEEAAVDTKTRMEQAAE